MKGQITLSINNVPWNEVLNAVVKTLNFTTVKESFGIIRIIHPDELLKQMEVRVFQLKYIAPPSTYQAKVEEGKTLKGQPLQSPTSIVDLLRRFVLAQTLKTVLSTDSGHRVVGTLNFDPQTNVFVIRDTKLVLDRVGEIIELLDREPEQVILDMKFISTTNKDLLQFGVNWSFGGRDGAQVGTRFLPVPASTDARASSGRISLMPFGWAAGERARQPSPDELRDEHGVPGVQERPVLRLIREPTLAVVDNTEATIFVGGTRCTPKSGPRRTSSAAEFRARGWQVPGQGTSCSSSPHRERREQGHSRSSAERVPVGPVERRGGPDSPDRADVQQQPADIDLPRLAQTQLFTKLVLESGHTAVLGGLRSSGRPTRTGSPSSRTSR